jgi:parallel beta-helix repeat protein
MKRMLIVLCLACLVLGAAATDWYVDPQAPPGGDGTPGNPFRYIDEALAVAGPGDTINCADGNYPALTLNDTESVLIQAMGGNAVIDGFVFMEPPGGDVTLSGFTIENSGVIVNDTACAAGGYVLDNCEVYQGYGIEINEAVNSVPTIQDCRITHCDNGINCKGSAAVISNCEISYNINAGLNHHDTSFPDTSSIANCDIHHNGTGGVIAEGACAPSYSDNDIHDNTANGIRLRDTAELTIEGGTLSDNENGLLLEDDSSATIMELVANENQENGLLVTGNAAVQSVSSSAFRYNDNNGVWFNSTTSMDLVLDSVDSTGNAANGLLLGAQPTGGPAGNPALHSGDAAPRTIPAEPRPAAQSVQISACDLSGNTATGLLINAAGDYTIEDCDLTDNDIGAYVGAGCEPDFGGGDQSSAGGNDFADADSFDFVNMSSADIYAKNCDWSASAEGEMDGEYPDTVDIEEIEDYWEDDTRGYVMWDDFSTEETTPLSWGALKGTF